VLNLVDGILASLFGFQHIKRGSRKKVVNLRPLSGSAMPEQSYKIETEQETDGRWIAEVVNLPGVMAYGNTQQEAIANAEALAFRVIADQIEQTKIGTSRVSFASA
jgi:predicted RNase H-like HicB family nuclease